MKFEVASWGIGLEFMAQGLQRFVSEFSGLGISYRFGLSPLK